MNRKSPRPSTAFTLAIAFAVLATAGCPNSDSVAGPPPASHLPHSTPRLRRRDVDWNISGRQTQ